MAKTDVGVALGARIRARREARHLSQAKLSELAEITPNYLGTLERGEALPTVQTLLVLAQSLDVEVADLFAASRDRWLDEFLAVAAAIPETHRKLAIELLRAVVRFGAGGQRAGTKKVLRGGRTTRAAR